MAAISRLVFVGVSAWLATAGGTLAQKRGASCVRIYRTIPPVCRFTRKSTVTGERPAMPVFNNLVVFDQHVAQNTMASIAPDLAEKWSWGKDSTNTDADQLIATGRGL